MSLRPFDARHLDVEAFARGGAELAGEWPLAALRRLLEACHADAASQAGAVVRWRARGEARGARAGGPEIWLHLSVEARPVLVCQRCLGPVAIEQAVERSLRFVPGEDEAERLDAESDDDVLALARTLDLQALVEDELLLALPLVPRHDTCPPDAPAQWAPDEEAEPSDEPHPFAGLAALKRGPRTPH